MVVSFVNAGLMNLSSGCWSYLGANIGTTVTSQLVSFNLSEIAPVFLMAGVIMVLFMNNPTVQKVGEVILGFGVLFMGLTSMSSAMSVLRDSPLITSSFRHWITISLVFYLDFIMTAYLTEFFCYCKYRSFDGISGIITSSNLLLYYSWM